jgi:hypothetical protein
LTQSEREIISLLAHQGEYSKEITPRLGAQSSIILREIKQILMPQKKA